MLLKSAVDISPPAAQSSKAYNQQPDNSREDRHGKERISQRKSYRPKVK